MKRSPSVDGMATLQPDESQVTALASRQPIQRAQRSALVMLALAGAMVALTVFQLWQSAQWQLWIVLVSLVTYAAIVVAAWRQFSRGQLARGGWLLIGGMYFVFPISAALTEGTGLTFAVCLFTLAVLLAPMMLPPRSATRALVIALVLSILTLTLGLIDIPGRASVPYASAVLPFVAVGLLVVLLTVTIRGFSSFSLRAKLIIVSLTVALIPLGLIGLFFAINAQQNAIAAANQALQAAAREAGASLDTFIQTNLNDVRVASQIPELADILTSTDRENTAYVAAETRAAGILRSLRRRDPIFLRSYALLDKDGNNLLDTSRTTMGTSEVTRDYFVAPFTNNLPYASPVTIDPETGRPAIYFSAPIRDSSGAFRGVLRARYDALVLQERITLNNGLAGSASGAMLLDENNIKLADGQQPDTLFKIVGQPTPEQIDSLKNVRRLPDLPAEDLMIASPEFERGLVNAAQQSTFEVAPKDSQNKDQVAISALSSQPWKVAFSRPQTEFLAPLNQQNRLILLAGLLSVLLVAGVAVLAAQTIARPVSALTETAQKISQGDLNAHAQVTTQDEIGTLARTFNSMTDQLRSMVTTLEDRVEARTAQLRTSAEVGRAATSILDPDQLLRQVVSLITDGFNFYYAAVFLLEEQGQAAVLRAATGEAGQTLLDRHHRLPITEESMVGAAIITRQPRIALDVGQGAVRFANPLLPNTRSEIALPLRVGDRVLGALDVQSEEAGAFDEANAEVLQVMADQIAVALFNAETFNRSEKQARVLAQLNQLSHSLAQATTREAVAFITAETVIELIGPCRMALIELTVNPQLLSARTLWPDATRPLSEPQSISANNSFSGECLKRGDVIYFPDLSTVLDRYEDAVMAYALGARAGAAVPLHIGDRIIGTFNISGDQVNAFTTEQLGQFEQVAAQVALTLDALNLTKQTQQALAELDAANRRLVGQVWSTHAQAGGLVAAEWRTGQWRTARLSESWAALPPSRALVPAAQTIELPIKVRGETIGEFSVMADTALTDWTTDDVAFAQSLIDQVGQVLENARLLEETERSAQREKAVADAADKIHRSTDIETVLQSAVAELNRITGRRGISIQLGFGQTNSLAGNGQSTDAEGDR
jgi:GAF domain-containing protein/HAMP domain-containing protein